MTPEGQATPSAQLSSWEDNSDAGSTVFEQITDPVENVQSYVPGGLHPVHLGDSLGDARYTMKRKLGYGSYSTVWLAQDNSKKDTYVALKIARADRDHTKEIQINHVLRNKADQHPGSASILMLKDHFCISGPNGNHDCLVYDVLGPSIEHLRDESPRLYTVAYFTLPSVRKIVRQVLLGLDYMHSVGIVHGDLYASNVLFTIEELPQESMEAVCQSYDEVSVDVKRISGSRQLGDPRHLVLNRPLNRFVSPNADVKLADLGNSFFEQDPPSNVETPAAIRSPELIVDGNVSMAQDCWAFGCLVYNMLTNCYPFDLGFVSSKEARDDTHLLQLAELLGPLPAKFKDRWPRYHLYFDDQGQLKNFDVDDDFETEDALSNTGSQHLPDGDRASTKSNTSHDGSDRKVREIPSAALSSDLGKPQHPFDTGLYPSIIKMFERRTFGNQCDPKSVAEYHALNPPLSQRWLAEKHPDLMSEESEAILNLLQGLLVYDPERRLSTKDILQHAWIRHYCAPSDESSEFLVQETTPSQMKRKRSGTDEMFLQDRKKGVTLRFNMDSSV